jgi:3-oxoacyl-[acyl-carrier-protein] synthase-3
MPVSVTTLERIESFLPQRSVPIDELADTLGLTRAKVQVYRKIFGLGNIRFDPEMGLFDLVLPAARTALSSVDDPGRIRHVIFAHTIQQLTPANIDAAQVIRDELGLRHADAFGLSQQNCASGLAAIDVAAELLRAEGDPDARALVVTGERASSPMVQLIPNTAIMGEAAAACVVAIDGAGDSVDSYVLRTLGEFAAGLLLDDAGNKQFGKSYPQTLAEVMRSAVAAAGLAFDDLDLVISQNVDSSGWREVIKELGVPKEKLFMDNVKHHGHCYTSDVFVNYTALRDAGRLVDGGRYLLITVGLGASFAAMVITHHSSTHQER